MQKTSRDLVLPEVADLVSRGQEGEGDAIAELLSRRRTRCLRTALAILRNWEHRMQSTVRISRTYGIEDDSEHKIRGAKLCST